MQQETTVYIPVGTLQYLRTDSEKPGNYKAEDKYSAVWFQSKDHGEVVYFDAISKRNGRGENFHNDLIDSQNGRNSGRYENLTVAPRPAHPGKFYVQLSKKYELI